jgi:hypothetical protein
MTGAGAPTSLADSSTLGSGTVSMAGFSKGATGTGSSILGPGEMFINLGGRRDLGLWSRFEQVTNTGGKTTANFKASLLFFWCGGFLLLNFFSDGGIDNRSGLTRERGLIYIRI